ncbi:unnamed protein product, partial [Iphiclides podalirius]
MGIKESTPVMRCCVATLWLSTLIALVASAPSSAEDAAPRDSPLAQLDNDLEVTDEEKRAWSSLHGGGGWGKRGWQDMSSAWGKRAWQDLNTAWGKRGWQDLNSAWGKRGWQDLNSAWGKRGWQDLNSAWGKRGWQDLNTAWGKRAWRDMYQSPWGKRGWQDMSSAWGKRGWQDMSSAWGKRGPSAKWVNFHGSWGKRAFDEPETEDYDVAVESILPAQQVEKVEKPEKKSWSALHGAWGKRPAKQAQYNSGSYYWKREPGWTNLRGMWGKRAQWHPNLDVLDTDEHESSTAADEA